MNNPIATIIKESEDKFASVAPENMTYAKEAGFALQTLDNNSYLKQVAEGNLKSLQRAVINIAAIGLTLNPAEKLAYLIPRSVKAGQNQWESRVFLEPSYMGLCKLATDSGVIEWIQAKPVYENDDFIDNGVGEKPTHKYQAFKERGAFVGVYCVAKLSGEREEYLTEIMTEEQVNDIRGRSEQWKKSQSGPWKTDYLEQAKKTVVRRAYKMWPRSNGMERLAAAVDLSNENEGFEPMQTSPEIHQCTGEQKAYFDQLIEKNDCIKMYVLWKTMTGGNGEGAGVSVWSSLTNSFKKGEKGKYNQIVSDLINNGESKLTDYLNGLEELAASGDDAGLNELLGELPQEAIDHISEICSEDLRLFIKEIREAA